MLAHALDLVEMGFAVFPVGPDCRVPRTPKREDRTGGVWLASKNPAVVRQMRWSGSNVAVATGAPSGCFVLDIDVKGADGFKEAEKLGLSPAWRSRTPSGGEHWWFKQPRQVLRNRVGFRPGLDIRTTGGSVAVPPSKKPGGPYVWIVPPWAAPLTDAPRAFLNLIDPPVPPARPLGKVSDAYVRAALERASGEVARTVAGRNHALFVAAASLGRFVAAGKIGSDHVAAALEGAAKSNGLWKEDGPRQVMATIHSGLSRGAAKRSDMSAEMRAIMERNPA